MSVTTQAREISGHPNLAPKKLGHKDLVARAAALIPQLRERVAEAEQTRKLPALNVEAVRNAGLFRVLQAARYGGHQQSLRTHIDTIALVAEGCSSTAWCMGVIHAHSWLMAHFPQAAQEETYGADPDAIISAIISPRGQAKPAKGGYMLNGVWPFGSGSQYAQWLFLGAAILNERGEVVDEADLLVPSRDVTIKDDWNVTGLRGTGSCTIVAQDVFVPANVKQAALIREPNGPKPRGIAPPAAESAAISLATSDQRKPARSSAGCTDPQWRHVRNEASAAKREETSSYFSCDNVVAVSHTSR